jgi:hypothetical protein
MMPVAISISSGLLLALVLWRVWINAQLADRGLAHDPQLDDEQWPPCSGEFVSSIFNEEDWEFVKTLNSKPLNALFQRERKSVARAWVRATAAWTQQIMREHVRIARSSVDLEIGPELRIYVRYAALQTACAFLLVTIGLVGPVRLRKMSLYVYGLSKHLSYAHWSLKSAIEAKELQEISRA